MTKRIVPFTGADSSWWHMEEPTNQMAITAVLVLSDPLDEDRFRSLLTRRLLIHDRFRQRVEESPSGLGRPRWVEVDHLRLEDHLRTEWLPAPGEKAELQALVGREMSTPLDPERPLWRFTHVAGYRGGSALVARLHHCIADGLALTHLLLNLDDDPSDPAGSYFGPPAVLPVRSPGGNPTGSRVLGGAAGAAGAALGMGARFVGSLGGLAGMRPDPRSSLRGPLSREKRAAWSVPLDLPEMRRVAKGVGATLNDLIVSTVAGGIGQFLTERGEQVSRQLRAVIPVNLRREHEQTSLGNRFGLVFAPLPVWVPDPIERIREVRRTMDRLKRSPQAGVVFGLLEFFGRTPRQALDAAVSFLGSKASLVLTNVPGPRRRIRFCGAEVVELVAWVPQSGRLSLGVSALTYADELRLGIAADAGLLPDAVGLVHSCERAAAQLLGRTTEYAKA
jgi:diacylglycerol O-acyltransferase / wax synthase